MAAGIYQIENQANGKGYIGSTVNVARRWQAHLNGLRRGQHENQHLQYAFDKYGEDAFEFCVLEGVRDSSQLAEGEQAYLDRLNPEYNICPTAGNCLGRPCSAETRRKLSVAAQGKPQSAETRSKKSEALRGERGFWYGKHLSTETKRKLSEAHKGQRPANYGKRLSEEHKRKISEAHRGKPLSAEHRAKLSEAHKGVKLSEAHCRAIREAWKARRRRERNACIS